MIAIVWEFIVKEETVAEFQRAYGPDGDWAVLFRRYTGYAGTTLLQDAELRTRFLTIDRWESEALFDRMLGESRQEYLRLDSAFSELTVSERKLGVFRAQ
jgi:hypothetical protein